MRTIKVKLDKDLSAYRGRDYYFCEESGRYYTRQPEGAIKYDKDGEVIKDDWKWLTTTDNYELEPDCHVADDVEIVIDTTFEGYHGGDTVYSKRHGKNMIIFMAHRREEVGSSEGAIVTGYTLSDMTNVTPDEVEDAH